eukprot:1950021-Pleurochrysis_carterae.AAC.1
MASELPRQQCAHHPPATARCDGRAAPTSSWSGAPAHAGSYFRAAPPLDSDGSPLNSGYEDAEHSDGGEEY